ncbi:MAG TPA: hypothetical protein VGR47_07425 [Terracidiphilus sp.]|nr:hypothetical protein [Terracidiphilus sp.]
MRLNNAQVVIGLLSAAILLFLFVCPSWQEAARNEIAYRKDIGRGFLWSPPKAVSVECYFIGCATAPASYFHVVLNLRLLLEQAIPVLFVAGVFLWLFRSQKEKQPPMLESRTRKLVISFSLALLVPPTGGAPMGAVLADVPRLVIEKDEFWAVLAILIPVLYFALSIAIYGLLSASHWIIARAEKTRSV